MMGFIRAYSWEPKYEKVFYNIKFCNHISLKYFLGYWVKDRVQTPSMILLIPIKYFPRLWIKDIVQTRDVHISHCNFSIGSPIGKMNFTQTLG